MNWNDLLSEKRIRKSSKSGSADKDTEQKSDIRNSFESDLGRIMYSPALRRMHDKTQVFPLTTDDNIHTRLTHSTEVMSLGYTFGLKCARSEIIQNKTKKSEAELLRIIPIILQSTCLIHDIGNPPFGHFAEQVISQYFGNIKDNAMLNQNAKKAYCELSQRQKNDFEHFDGNAQGLRVIMKLQYLDDIFGINLTYAVLASYLKYPNFYSDSMDDETVKKLKKQDIARGKHGVFYSEHDFFLKIAKECGLQNSKEAAKRHPLSFLMEAADTIAYRVMDIEDGFSKGYVSIWNIKDAFEPNNSELSKGILSICDDKELKPGAKMVKIRIAIIDYLVDLAYKNFEKNINEIEEGSYPYELLDADPSEVNDILKKLCTENIFSTREINHLETTGYSVITGLLNHYINQLFHPVPAFTNRAESLISKSTIKVALEEDMPNYLTKKYNEINPRDKDKGKYSSLNSDISKYIELVKTHKDVQEIEYNQIKLLRNRIFNSFQAIGSPISFSDLSPYYKYRIIVDFISGMTDQFALSHFQKISGQKIA